MEYKICSNKKCPELNPQELNNFRKRSKKTNIYRSWCNSCLSLKSKLWREKNKEKVKNKIKIWQKENINHLREYQRKWRKKNPNKRKGQWLKKYWPGSTSIEAINNYNILLKEQKELCAICKREAKNFIKDLFVDHCHKTGKVRGLLCDKCNKAIGLLEDSAINALNAFRYLK